MVECMLPKVKRIKVLKTKVRGKKIPMLMANVMAINRPQVPFNPPVVLVVTTDAIRWCMNQLLTQRCLSPEWREHPLMYDKRMTNIRINRRLPVAAES